MRVFGETGVHLRVNLFTDEIRLQPALPKQLAVEASASSEDSDRPAFPRVLALPRTATDAFSFADSRSGGPFAPSLLELIEAQLTFAEAVHGNQPRRHQQRQAAVTRAERSVTLEIDPAIMRRRRTPGLD